MEIPLEDYAAAAEELLLDWEHQAVVVSAPNHLQSEIIKRVPAGVSSGRITAEEAQEAIQDLLALPFVLVDVAPFAERAFAIACQHNQRCHDCLYVALAEREGGALSTGGSITRCIPPMGLSGGSETTRANGRRDGLAASQLPHRSMLATLVRQ